MSGGNRQSIGDPLYGSPSQPSGYPAGSNPSYPSQGQGYGPGAGNQGYGPGSGNQGYGPGANQGNGQGYGPNDNLNKSYNQLNKTYLDENSWRGDGANVISDRLNFGGVRKVIEGAPQVHYVPKEIVKIVEEEEYISAPVPVTTYDDSINVNGRNILAESMAKVALLIMENTRLKWVESQRNAEISRLRAVPVVTEVARPVVTEVRVEAPPVCPTCSRPYAHGFAGPAHTAHFHQSSVHHVTSAPVVTTGAVLRPSQTHVVRPGITTTGVIAAAPVRLSGHTTAPVVRVGGQTTGVSHISAPTYSGAVVRSSNGYTTTGPVTTVGAVRTSGTGVVVGQSSIAGVRPAGTTTFGATSVARPAGTTTVGGTTTFGNTLNSVAGVVRNGGAQTTTTGTSVARPAGTTTVGGTTTLGNTLNSVAGVVRNGGAQTTTTGTSVARPAGTTTVGGTLNAVAGLVRNGGAQTTTTGTSVARPAGTTGVTTTAARPAGTTTSAQAPPKTAGSTVVTPTVATSTIVAPK